MQFRDAQGQVVHKASERYTIGGRLADLDESRRRRAAVLPAAAARARRLHARGDRAGLAHRQGERARLEPGGAAGDRVVRCGWARHSCVRRAEQVPAAERDAGNPLYFGDLLLYPNLGQPLSKAADKELAFGFTAYDGHGAAGRGDAELLHRARPSPTVPLALGAADGRAGSTRSASCRWTRSHPGTYELRVTVTAGAQHVTRGVPFAIAAN